MHELKLKVDRGLGQFELTGHRLHLLPGAAGAEALGQLAPDRRGGGLLEVALQLALLRRSTARAAPGPEGRRALLAGAALAGVDAVASWRRQQAFSPLAAEAARDLVV